MAGAASGIEPGLRVLVAEALAARGVPLVLATAHEAVRLPALRHARPTSASRPTRGASRACSRRPGNGR
jgi:hypothetical protein